MGKARNQKKKKKIKHQKSRSIFTIIKHWWHLKHPVLLFMFGFIGLAVLFYFLINLSYFKLNMHPKLNAFYAAVSSLILNLLGYQTTVSNSLIQSSLFSIDIEQGCDALEPIGLFTAAVIAYPVAIRKKLVGLLIGPFLLCILNIIRIVSLFFIGIYYQKIFEVMHIEVWQVLFILLSTALCFVWIKWSIHSSNKN